MLGLILIGVSLAFLTLFFIFRKKNEKDEKKTAKIQSKIIEKPKLGRIRIYFGSQTGTAAKLSENLAEEATEKGFSPEIVDLKDLQIRHFETKNEISLFLVSNTGEGDAPENAQRFMKVLKGKQQLHEQRNVNWSLINYAVFGLGNTQYEHFNKIGKETDALLGKAGANRLVEIGLGDDNSSLQDDFIGWRKVMWPAIISFRNSNPLDLSQEEPKEITNIRKVSSHMENSYKISNQIPIYAQFQFFQPAPQQEIQHIPDDELDFKTKNSLRAHKSLVKSVVQVRQNTKDGSTLDLEIQLDGQPEYQTAGNIALYPKNDPQIVEEVIQYFKLTKSQLNNAIAVERLNPDKKLKLNFKPNHTTILTILQEDIDLQGKLTKSLLKKLAKFNSKDNNYFLDHSNAKTTEEYRRLTEIHQKAELQYLFRLVKQYSVEMCIEDFIELSDSMAPRLFTIASHWKTQKNVSVAASLTDKGLISKCFERKPTDFYAELRKSTFTDAMKWKKVLFVSAGTGLAPFRGFLQQKQFYETQNSKSQQQHNIPIVSMYFGCKHQNGDFIYKEQLLRWQEKKIINRLKLAFSRDTDKKIYVQDLLDREEEELAQFIASPDEALYICGSLPMGQTITALIAKRVGEEKLALLQKEGRIVKQLW